MDMMWLFIIPIITFLAAAVYGCTKYPPTFCPNHKESKMTCIGGHGITPGAINTVSFWLCDKCDRIWVSRPGQTEMHLPRDEEEWIYARMYLREYKEKKK